MTQRWPGPSNSRVKRRVSSHKRNLQPQIACRIPNRARPVLIPLEHPCFFRVPRSHITLIPVVSYPYINPYNPCSFHFLFHSPYINYPIFFRVPSNHILTQNLYYDYYYPKARYLIIGYMDPLGHFSGSPRVI